MYKDCTTGCMAGLVFFKFVQAMALSIVMQRASIINISFVS